MKKIASYNVNGIRAAFTKGLLAWLETDCPDLVCIQETKAQPEQIASSDFDKLGYHQYWFSAKKRGYSGVGILSKEKPDKVVMGMGMEKYDLEGRVIRADFGSVSVISAYFPSGSSGDERQKYKMDFLADFQAYINELTKTRKKIVISGDYNICHKPIDIHDPVRNKKTSGFLPEEREWVTQFVESGFTDSFREFQPEPDHYSWWSYRANARANNKGWRIDYHMVSNALKSQLKGASILPNVKQSDHCPIMVEIDF